MADTPGNMRDLAAGGSHPRRLFVYDGGFLFRSRIRRILALAGWRVSLGRPDSDDHVGIRGHGPKALRAERVATATGAPILRVEHSFLRPVRQGLSGGPPLGLTLDGRSAYYDSAQPSDLEVLLAAAPLDDTALLNRARDAIQRLKRHHLSGHNDHDPILQPPDPGYVLVLDQTRGDPAIARGAGSAALFDEMLAFAQIEHPGARILLKTHPETRSVHRTGHYGPRHEDGRTRIHAEPVSPWALLDGAIAVYTVTSQLGFEAILAGHRPRVFGQPFYGGWGLSADENPCPRRERRLTRAQLFAGAMIHYPIWYDPFADRLCELETAMATLETDARIWREDRHGHVASGMRPWKRGALQKVFGRHKRLIFEDDPKRASIRALETGRGLLVRAGKVEPGHGTGLRLVEDGFLRSPGPGADLVPPISVVADDLGIYYDPTRPSRLETLIADSTSLCASDLDRAARLIEAITTLGPSRHDIGSAELPELAKGHRILVPGQSEDDAPVRLGCKGCRTNLDLLRTVRDANPDAVILYAPRSDVEAGLGAGRIPRDEAAHLADHVLHRADPAALLMHVDAVWTMTSPLGFEALLRGRAVTTLGTPFYAGWGLTRDLGDVPSRRVTRPSLEQLAHAVLIDYPRYLDLVTGRPCPPEVAVARLAEGRSSAGGPVSRLLARAKGLLARRTDLWR